MRLYTVAIDSCKDCPNNRLKTELLALCAITGEFINIPDGIPKSCTLPRIEEIEKTNGDTIPKV